MPKRLYLVRPDVKTTTITASELNLYSDEQLASINNVTTARYLFINCEEFSIPEEKKVKVTRFANRGSVSIDLREIFSIFTAKNILLGNRFDINTRTRTAIRERCWRYAFNEWGKIGNGKIGIKDVDITTTAGGAIHTATDNGSLLKVYKSGNFVDVSYTWQKSLPIDVDFVGNVVIKQIELEEQL